MNNPYKVLGLKQDASKTDIIKGKMAAMKERKYSLQEIQLAEKHLLNPSKRLAADFLYPAKLKTKRPQRVEIDIVISDDNLGLLDHNKFDSLL